jgi:hypothetical protein
VAVFADAAHILSETFLRRSIMMNVNPLVSFFVLFITLLTGCGGGDDGFSGANASLSWEPVIHHTPISYTVHFGKQSRGETRSCNYEYSVDVSEPFAIITGLEFNTLYYFAVSAYAEHGHRSHCSNEVSKLTPESQVAT